MYQLVKKHIHPNPVVIDADDLIQNPGKFVTFSSRKLAFSTILLNKSNVIEISFFLRSNLVQFGFVSIKLIHHLPDLCGKSNVIEISLFLRSNLVQFGFVSIKPIHHLSDLCRKLLFQYTCLTIF